MGVRFLDDDPILGALLFKPLVYGLVTLFPPGPLAPPMDAHAAINSNSTTLEISVFPSLRSVLLSFSYLLN